MLVGTADVAALVRAQATATIERFAAEPIELADVACFQLTAEMRKSAREAVLPPSLHPTIPPALSLQVWSVAGSPWGAFRLAIARVSCRSGVRARGFTTAAFVSSRDACEGLRATFGFPARVAEVELRRGYDGVDVAATFESRRILALTAIDPEPLDRSDVQYTGTLNLAHTPLGLRLVQVEADHEASRVERLAARLHAFEPVAWGDARLVPVHVVSSSLALEHVVLPPVRFVCRADELAFTGTESVVAT
jgi:hypothetical protein